jgi:hypothetical protein
MSVGGISFKSVAKLKYFGTVPQKQCHKNKVAFRKKVRADTSPGIAASIRSRIAYLATFKMCRNVIWASG